MLIVEQVKDRLLLLLARRDPTRVLFRLQNTSQPADNSRRGVNTKTPGLINHFPRVTLAVHDDASAVYTGEDMQRLSKATPAASRAREGLEELVRQAEERVNGKKAELLKLRQDLSTLNAALTALAATPRINPPSSGTNNRRVCETPCPSLR